MIENNNTPDILLLAVGNNEEDDRREIPLGLAFLGSSLSKHGYSYKVIDLYNNNPENTDGLNDLLLKILTQFSPRVIGISATSYYLKMVRETVKTIKYFLCQKAIKIPIILGGYISLIPHVIKRIGADGTDVVCFGEGDKTLPELLDYYFKKENSKNLHKISGISYLDKKGNECQTAEKRSIENLDSLPFPEFKEFDLKSYNYNGKIDSLPMYSQRGCYNNCSFCDIVNFYGIKYIRRISPERIIAWIHNVQNQYGITRIDFMDDNFLNSRRFIMKFFELLQSNFGGSTESSESSESPSPKELSQKPGIKINFQARSNEILRFKDILEKYSRFINCIEIGTESFSQSQLNRWNKNNTVLDNIKCLEMLTNLGIPYINFYLWLDERTTIEEIDENIEKLLDLPEVPIVGSKITAPNFVINYEISAIYDLYGVSSVQKVTHLNAMESFLNETNDSAKKISIIYIGLKKVLETLSNSEENRSIISDLPDKSHFLSKVGEISEIFFPAAEKVLKQRLYIAITIAENIKKIRFGKKIGAKKIIWNRVKDFNQITEKLIEPIKQSLGIDLENLMKF